MAIELTLLPEPLSPTMTEDVPLLHPVGDAVHRIDHTILCVEAHREILNLQ